MAPVGCGYVGVLCLLLIMLGGLVGSTSPCDATPCKHEGVCKETTPIEGGEEEYSCSCTARYAGITCEADAAAANSDHFDHVGLAIGIIATLLLAVSCFTFLFIS